MAAAERDQVGVALAQPDALVGDAQAIGEDLRKRRLVALADLCVPVISDTVPSGSKRMSTFSSGGPPVPLM